MRQPTYFSATTAFLLFFACSLCIVKTSTAFTISPLSGKHNTLTNNNWQLYGWADAFKNDDTLGKVENAGIKGGPKFNEQVTVNGKAVTGAVAGQKITAVAMKARVKIPVNCQKGDCGTCMVLLNGRKVKGCQTPLPTGKATIVTL